MEDKPAEEDIPALGLTEKLSEQFGTKVVIRRNAKGKGKVTIDFDDIEQLEYLLNTKLGRN